MLPQDDSTGHNKFPKPDKILTPFHAVALEMEKRVVEGHFTAWSCATPESLLSCFFADEACPSLDGLADPEGPFHPTFDLGSLTKPLFLNAILRNQFAHAPEILLQPVLATLSHRNEAGLQLQRELQKHQHLRWVDFLDHTSGMRWWFWFGRGHWAFKQDSRGRFQIPSRGHLDVSNPEIYRELFCSTLIEASFEKIRTNEIATTYSDPNYFLLGQLLENCSLLENFDWKDALNTLNESWGTEFFHASLTPHRARTAIPFYPYLSTQNLEAGAFEHPDTCFGSALDTNANVLSSIGKTIGVVSGHAGLFGSAADVLAGVEYLSKSQADFLRRPEFQNYFHENSAQRFQVGLDTPSSEKSLAGLKHWPLPDNTRVFGHLGYTGTSFWFSLGGNHLPESHVMLTNRTAHRTSYGSTFVPRVCVQTHYTTGLTSYFLSTKKGAWNEISEDSAFEVLQTYRNSTRHIWEQSRLRSPSNINETRQNVGRLLWNL